MNSEAALYFPGKVIFGAGTATLAGREVRALGFRSAALVTDQGLVGTEVIATVKRSLGDEGIRHQVFSDLAGEPEDVTIDACGRAVAEGGFEVVIGVGGGSVLDTAKGVSILATSGGGVADYIGFGRVGRRGLPKILLPTTAGSGSEATRVFAFTERNTSLKSVVYTDFNLAEAVILDPFATVSLPPGLTAETGADVLAHAVESFVSRGANPFSDVLAIQAVRLVGENLRRAYAKASDLEARSNMLMAATTAGLAWGSGGLGAVHALSYVLETAFKIGHARACAALLPHVIQYNAIGNLERYGRIAKVLGDGLGNVSDREAGRRCAAVVRDLLRDVGLLSGITSFGITSADLPLLVDGALRQDRLFVFNPRDVNKEAVEAIYSSALEG